MSDQQLGEALLEAGLRHAQRPALWAEDKHYTYEDLFTHAARLANTLQDAGVRPGERVCILSERTLTLAAGVLAALLAGCAYVPLSREYSAERNATILRVSDAAALILDSRCAGRLEAHLGSLPADLLVICPEADTPPPPVKRVIMADGLSGSSYDTLAVAQGLSPDLLAYLMFTSGSTGAPKGVPITGRNLIAFLEGLEHVAEFKSDDRVQQLVDLAFDFSVMDLFPAWLNGSQLFFVPPFHGRLTPRFIARHEITSCTLVPSLAALCVQEKRVRPGGMASLRQSFFCGEALPTAIAAAWQAGAPKGRVINLYGPTEATVALTAFEYVPDTDLPVVPIGRPFRDQRVEPFGPDLQPLAPGVTGELFLSGSQLTEGYWRAPEVDQEKFVIVDGQRWYRTGDLGRTDERYGLVFAGRADRQIKIHGYLAELQDIEAILRRASGRQEVAVIAWPRTSDTSAAGLVAFIKGEPFDENAVRTEFMTVGEHYMVPDRFVFTSELPKNANGKLDYKALTHQLAAET